MEDGEMVAALEAGIEEDLEEEEEDVMATEDGDRHYLNV